MNGIVYMRHSIDNIFKPSARLLQPNIGEVRISPQIEVVVYTAAEARRYMTAFAEVAALLDEQEAKAAEAAAAPQADERAQS